MGLLLYFATGVATLIAATRITRFSRGAALILLLVPLVPAGRALVTGAVYGPLDLAYAAEPLVAIGDRVGVRHVVNPSISDVYTEFMPWNDALRRAIAARQWPLWNPYELCGTPLAGAAQAAPYHPVTVIGLLVPLPQYFAFAAAMLFFTAALAAFLLLRDLVESETAALSAAVAWMFSTHLVFFAGTALAHAVALTPLLLLGARRIVRDPGARSAVLLTIALVLIVLAGHPESALHVVTFAVVYTGYQMMVVRPLRIGRVFGAGIGSGVAALLLTAFFLLPHLEVITQSEEYVHRALGYRHPVSTTAQMAHRLRANFLPFLEGAPGVEEIRHDESVKHGWLATAYGGSLLIALALAGLFAPVPEKWFFGGAILFGLLAGISAPGITPLLEMLPGFAIAVNDRMVAFATLGMCVLAAGALDRWRPRFAWIFAALAMLVVASALFAPADLSREYVWLGAARSAIPLFIAALLWRTGNRACPLLLVLILLQRAGETASIQPTVPARAFYPPFPGVELMNGDEPFRIVALGTILPPALSTHYGLEDVRGFQAVTLWRYDATYPLWSVRQPVWFNRVDDLASPFLSLMNVRFALVPHGAAIPPWWTRRGEFPSYDVVENTRVLPRAFIPRSVAFATTAQESLAGTRSAADFGLLSWIEREGPRETSANGSGTVAVSGRGGRLRLRATMHSAGWVVISNAAWKGWIARSRGEELPVRFANHAFLAVELPAGQHQVELIYRPRSVVTGALISVTALILLTALRRRYRART